jgi:DNA-binding NarL/FixJ family response regulator
VTLATAPIRALLIEDNPGDARLIHEMLRDAGGAAATVELAHADRLAPGLQQLAKQVTDVVLLDLTLPDSQGFDTFTTVYTQAPNVAIVVLSGLDDETLAVRAVQEGAQDYLFKRAGRWRGHPAVDALRAGAPAAGNGEARDLERQRDEFFASVSHDLRTPVAIKAAFGVVLANMPATVPAPLQRLLGNMDLAATS